MKKFIGMAAAVVLAGATASADVKWSGEAGFQWQSLSSKQQNDYFGLLKADHDTFVVNHGIIDVEGGSDAAGFTGRLMWAKDDATGEMTPMFSIAALTTKNALGNWMFGRMETTMRYESFRRSENAFYTFSLGARAELNTPAGVEGVRWNKEYSFATLNLGVYNGLATTGADTTNRRAVEFSAEGKAGEGTWFAGYLQNTTDGDTGTAGLQDAKATRINAWYEMMATEAVKVAVEYSSYNIKPEDSALDEVTVSDIALQGTYMMGMHNISLRYEMVSDKDAMVTGSKTHTAITLGDKIKLEENLSLYAEYYMQTAKDEIFVDADGETTKNLSAMTLGLVATF